MHKERDDMYMIAYVAENVMNWSVQGAADSLTMVREIQEGDTVTMKDMHDGYFYLKGHSRSHDYSFYEQNIIDGRYIYSLCIFYPYYMNDEEVQNIIKLVHDWNPK